MRPITLALVLTFVIGTRLIAADAPATSPATKPAETMNVADTEALKAAVDKTVTVKGAVSRTAWSPRGSVLFVNFEGVSRDGFTAIVKKEDKDAVSKFGEDASELVGKTVEITGKIILYKGRSDTEKPEIEISKAEQIKVVEAPTTQPAEPPAK